MYVCGLVIPHISFIEQYYHIFPSHHVNTHSAWQHAIGVSWVPVTANPVNISQLTNNMWIQPCYGITIVMLYNAGWFWDGHTTYFLHTTLMSTLQDSMATWCRGTLLQQQTRSIYHHYPTICESNHAVSSLPSGYTMQYCCWTVIPHISFTPS